MNTSNNSRYQETEQKIKDAFFHLLNTGRTIDRIFVQDVCRIAEISRPSFYAHYEDINDLVIQIEKEKAEKIQSILMSEALPPVQVFKQYFEYLKANQSFYIAYFCSGDNSHISQSMMDVYLQENIEFYIKSGLDKESVRYLMTFFSSGLKAIALQWLKGGCRESSSDMVALLDRVYSWHL